MIRRIVVRYSALDRWCVVADHTDKTSTQLAWNIGSKAEAEKIAADACVMLDIPIPAPGMQK